MKAERTAEKIFAEIWQPEGGKLTKGAWLWWFWIFFIHDKETAKTGKCKQLMILWSVKNDPQIDCNGLDIRVKKQIAALGEGKWLLDGAAAAWYFDGERMHENFVLEKSRMELDSQRRSIIAPGKTPSKFFEKNGEYFTVIEADGKKFEFRARQVDLNPAVGPNHGESVLPLGMRIEGTRIEVLKLGGTEEDGKGKREIFGTAYFQKILLAVPPPQWYWGIYHFADGSFFTFMQPYVGRAMLAGNLTAQPKLKKPTAAVNSDSFFYHAPSGKLYQTNRVAVVPEKIGDGLWRHKIAAKGGGFEIFAVADSYAHACWEFTKKIGALPPKSKFHYNEYPAVLKRLVLRTGEEKEIIYENGAGNMENSWGFLI